MKRLRILSLVVLILALIAAPAFAATGGSTGTQQGVQISSQVVGTVAGVGPVNLTFIGSAAHTLNGLNVIFNVKLLTAATSPLGPLSLTLDPTRPSTGTLSSTTFPAVHTQNFFVLISSRAGTLTSDSPLTLQATIQSTPPTATYKSIGGNVVFYQQGDPNKRPVLTVQSVTSDVKPATTQTVNIASVVTASLGSTQATIQLNGSASNLVSGTSVLFINKSLTAVNPGPLGTTTASLDTRQPSSGTLGSTSFPTTHTQSFFLQIQSQALGTLVADTPIILSATIQSCPPNATYKLSGPAVPFYQLGDPSKKTLLTVENVVSTVTPPAK
jgi:hypothetical protein